MSAPCEVITLSLFLSTPIEYEVRTVIHTHEHSHCSDNYPETSEASQTNFVSVSIPLGPSSEPETSTEKTPKRGWNDGVTGWPYNKGPAPPLSSRTQNYASQEASQTDSDFCPTVCSNPSDTAVTDLSNLFGALSKSTAHTPFACLHTNKCPRNQPYPWRI